MAIEDIKQLKKVTNEGPAQELLNQGWTLLAVCVCQDGANQYAEFHLGHSDQPEEQTAQGGVLLPKRIRESLKAVQTYAKD
ncbi:hypothetical protein JC795_01735 [Pseudomonas veronii]|uniref:hypothetical protein n=1 Tax=Pseudomonas veronii TaxID=76761 RepID=UPI0018E70905|nr:hypothetical protein [Pseudomonas veronii]MBJ2176908.1 hypothetical protein [Pseudomonas veronii]